MKKKPRKLKTYYYRGGEIKAKNRKEAREIAVIEARAENTLSKLQGR